MEFKCHLQHGLCNQSYLTLQSLASPPSRRVPRGSSPAHCGHLPRTPVLSQPLWQVQLEQKSNVSLCLKGVLTVLETGKSNDNCK